MTTHEDRVLEGGRRPDAPLSRAHAAAVLRLGVSVEQDEASGVRAAGLEDQERGSIAPNAPFAGDTRRAAAAGGITVAMLVAAGIGIPDSGQIAPIGGATGGSVEGRPGSTAVRSAIDASGDRRQEQDPMKTPGVRAAVVAGVVMVASSAGHASQNFQLGPVIKSGTVTIVPGDMFEATMRITPTHVAAELHNLTRPTEIFRVERTWSGAPFGNKLVCYNREFCDDRTDLHEIVVGRIAANTSDCDSDGVTDSCEIRAGAADSNSNGIPDLCELPTCIDADLNPNGIVDGADLGAMLAFWGPVSPAFPRADINGDGNVNGADLGILLSLWGPCGG